MPSAVLSGYLTSVVGLCFAARWAALLSVAGTPKEFFTFTHSNFHSHLQVKCLQCTAQLRKRRAGLQHFTLTWKGIKVHDGVTGSSYRDSGLSSCNMSRRGQLAFGNGWRAQKKQTICFADSGGFSATAVIPFISSSMFCFIQLLSSGWTSSAFLKWIFRQRGIVCH